MEDPFSYSARWDSAGLDCSFCIHESKVKWPNIRKDYACCLHQVSLIKELGSDGYKEGEWFCSDFSDNGKANPKSVQEFMEIRNVLKPNVLYGAYGPANNLKEIAFSELKSNT
ncbi:MAG: hypothetical protein U9N57_03830 [Pseudomonadota bacterium]|nr:hypothetical protein [Pseudomonadota bacterium]